MAKDKDRRPQEDLLVVHCFCIYMRTWCTVGRSIYLVYTSAWNVNFCLLSYLGFLLSVFTVLYFTGDIVFIVFGFICYVIS